MLPIRYPKNLSMDGFSGKMHDLNESLCNPRPRSDWAVGDVAWLYVRNRKKLIAGPITTITTNCAKPHAFIHDLNPSENDPDWELGFFQELFSTEEELMAAMLRFDPPRIVKAPVSYDGFSLRPLFANPLTDDPGCDTPGDICGSLDELQALHPGCRVLFGFCVVDPKTGAVCEGCGDWHPDAESAYAEYFTATGQAQETGKTSVALDLVPGNEIYVDTGIRGILKYTVTDVSIPEAPRPIRYRAKAKDVPENSVPELDFTPADLGKTVFLTEQAAKAALYGDGPETEIQPFVLNLSFDGNGLSVDATDSGSADADIDYILSKGSRYDLERTILGLVRTALSKEPPEDG